MRFESTEPFSIGIYRATNAGVPVTGQVIRCYVFDSRTGLKTLPATTMIETPLNSGFYTFLWSAPPLVVPRNYVVVIFTGTGATGPIIDSYRIRAISDLKILTDTIDLNDGSIS